MKTSLDLNGNPYPLLVSTASPDYNSSLQCQETDTASMNVQVAKVLVQEAESNIGKKEYDANDGLVRHSDATKIQSIADRVKLHGDRGTLPEAVGHVAEAVKKLGIAQKPEKPEE